MNRYIAIFIFLLCIIPNISSATIYYLRSDGGDKNQCTGLVNAPINANKQCGFNLVSMDLNVSASGADIINIAPGNYRVTVGPIPSACVPTWCGAVLPICGQISYGVDECGQSCSKPSVQWPIPGRCIPAPAVIVYSVTMTTFKNKTSFYTDAINKGAKVYIFNYGGKDYEVKLK